jgi:GNAT superfamily N-acetyltransferase
MKGYTVRRVLIGEYPKYRVHLKALDLESRYLRFGFNANDAIIDKFCDDLEKNTKKHVLFCIENDKLEFVAIGHIALIGEMELAFSVLKERQGQGMGDALMKRCIRYCRTHNILKGNMICLSHNAPIKHLCVKNRIKIHTEHGETAADIELKEPSLNTFVTEGVAINSAVIDYMGKRAMLPWTLFTQRD